MNIRRLAGAFRCTLCLARLDGRQAFCDPCLGDLPWRSAPGGWDPGFPLRAAFWFEPPVSWLINTAKSTKNPAIFGQLGALMALRETPPLDPDYVVCPIPMRWERRVRRGFNQSWLLAEALARRFGWKLEQGLLSRVGQGQAQKALGRTERLALGADAFRAHPAVEGHRILLVDDVYTTGATLRAARGALLTGGARSVAAWVCAVVP